MPSAARAFAAPTRRRTFLHYALQKYLGKHAQQQGSKVDDDWLRFDFANPSAVDRRDAGEDRERGERPGHAAPRPFGWKYMPIADARKTGAMMLFGEKYPDIVRMVVDGRVQQGAVRRHARRATPARSACSESSAKRASRPARAAITALTGRAALAARCAKSEAVLAEIAGQLRVPTSEVPERVAALAKEVRDLKKQLAAGKRRAA